MQQPVKQIAKRILPLLPRPMRQLLRSVVWSLGDATGRHGVPPAYERVKTYGDMDIPAFLFAGENDADTLLKVLEHAGVSPVDCSNVLDFGCGVGRILARLRSKLPQAQLYGTDVDIAAIRWCQRNLTSLATFSVNAHTPPLSYADEQFDFIYSWSVFTHLDEEFQFRWLQELRRVTHPGATLVLTVFGPSQMPRHWPHEHEFAEHGFYSERRQKWADFYPPFYQSTLHTRAYIEKHWSSFFTLTDYLEKRAGNQDIVVLQRVND